MSDDRKLTTRELLNTPDSVLEIIAALRTKMEKVEKERDEAQHSQKDWDHLKNLLLHANIDCETWYTRYEALRTERDTLSAKVMHLEEALAEANNHNGVCVLEHGKYPHTCFSKPLCELFHYMRQGKEKG
jgi:chromosome segregation ATPase